jgi:geranylgeranyl pyrophosphate synthase
MVSFSSVRDRLGAKIESYLQQLIQGQSAATGKALSSMTAYHFQTGGKRLRALIPSYVYENLGFSGDKIVPFGAAVEMVHNATLVHDDLQDGDQVRRGQPTVWKKYSQAQAINVGDAMFQYAYLPLLDLDLPPEHVNKLMGTMAHSTIKVIEGQAQEFIMKEENYPGLRRYIEVIKGKTSGLFALPIVGAMEAAGVSAELCSVAQQAAQELGVLFQIQDDFLDLYGAKGRDRSATDIAEGKISYLAAYVFENASEAQKKRFSEILKTPRLQTSDEEISEALEIIDKCGAKKSALHKVQSVKEELKTNTLLKAKLPGVHHVFDELSDVFLEPISAHFNSLAGGQ